MKTKWFLYANTSVLHTDPRSHDVTQKTPLKGHKDLSSTDYSILELQRRHLVSGNTWGFVFIKC